MKTITKLVLGSAFVAGIIAGREAFGRAWCGLWGHTTHLNFEKNRMSLKCVCGYETEGWEVGRPAAWGPAAATKLTKQQNLRMVKKIA